MDVKASNGGRIISRLVKVCRVSNGALCEECTFKKVLLCGFHGSVWCHLSSDGCLVAVIALWLLLSAGGSVSLGNLSFDCNRVTVESA